MNVDYKLDVRGQIGLSRKQHPEFQTFTVTCWIAFFLYRSGSETSSQTYLVSEVLGRVSLCSVIFQPQQDWNSKLHNHVGVY